MRDDGRGFSEGGIDTALQQKEGTSLPLDMVTGVFEPAGGAPASSGISQPISAHEASAGSSAEGEGAQGDPDFYALEVPEGFILTQKQLDEVVPLFRELGLSLEQAQKLTDYYVRRREEEQENEESAWERMTASWVDLARDDEEFGGQELERNLGYARQALERFGSPELMRDMETYRMGNHPEVIRILCRVGKAMQGDSLVRGGRSHAPMDAAHILYPDWN